MSTKIQHENTFGGKSSWPLYSDEEVAAVTKVLRSNKVNYWTGVEGKHFENEFAGYVNARHGIAMANGTVVLDAALRTLGITSGDEVIVTSRTYIASASAIVNVGALPVFADVDRDSQNMTASSIEKCISKRTKAIMCVHLAGWPCEMDKIADLAAQNNIKIIEDCAQAHGAKYNDQNVGTFSDIAGWSFCQDKIMSTGGEGGMVTTNNEKYWKKMWAMKDHGKEFDTVFSEEHPPGFRWLHESFGHNWRMTEMQAAIGRIQLKKLDEWVDARRTNASLIWEHCERIPSLRVPAIPNNIYHAAYKCYVFVKPEALKSGWNRDRLLAELAQQNVSAFSGSCSEVYMEKAFSNAGIQPKSRLEVAMELGNTSLMFLVHPTMHRYEIDRTLDGLSNVMKRATL